MVCSFLDIVFFDSLFWPQLCRDRVSASSISRGDLRISWIILPFETIDVRKGLTLQRGYHKGLTYPDGVVFEAIDLDEVVHAYMILARYGEKRITGAYLVIFDIFIWLAVAAVLEVVLCSTER
jgi:hypothetical protein